MVDVLADHTTSSGPVVSHHGARARGPGVLPEGSAGFADADAPLELVHDVSTQSNDVSDGGVGPMCTPGEPFCPGSPNTGLMTGLVVSGTTTTSSGVTTMTGSPIRTPDPA
jgi:hypothetical protein